MDIRNYWFKTVTPTYLVRLLQDNPVSLSDLTGKYYDESQFLDNDTERKSLLPLIYQNGYLTIKDYDRELQTYLLDFPNDEVKTGFKVLVVSENKI